MTDTTDTAALMLKMRTLADRIIDAEGENNNGEVGKIIEMYDAADTTFKAQNILLVLNTFEAERQRADNLVLHVNTQANMREKTEADLIKEREHSANFEREANLYHEKCETAEAEIAALKAKLANPVVLKPAYTQSDYSRLVLEATDAYGLAWGSSATRDDCVKQIREAGFTVKGE